MTTQFVTPAPAPPARAAIRALERVFGALLAAALLALAFRNVDIRTSLRAVTGAGWPILGIFAPSAVAVTLEAVAWGLSARTLGKSPRIRDMLRVRVATEWIANALPLGALWAEGLKPPLLARHGAFSFAEGVTLVLARKYLLLASQSVYLLFGCFWGAPLAAGAFPDVPSWLITVGVAGLAAGLLVASELMRLVLGRSALAAAATTRLSRSRIRSVARVAERCTATAAQTDRNTALFFGTTRKELAGPALLCLAGWVLEATETWLIFHVLGVNLAFERALGAEALVVLLRHVVVFVPAGLGVQELGYAALLGDDVGGIAVCMTFAVVKRAKELAWVVLGGALLVAEKPENRVCISVS